MKYEADILHWLYFSLSFLPLGWTESKFIGIGIPCFSPFSVLLQKYIIVMTLNTDDHANREKGKIELFSKKRKRIMHNFFLLFVGYLKNKFSTFLTTFNFSSYLNGFVFFFLKISFDI